MRKRPARCESCGEAEAELPPPYPYPARCKSCGEAEAELPPHTPTPPIFFAKILANFLAMSQKIANFARDFEHFSLTNSQVLVN